MDIGVLTNKMNETINQTKFWNVILDNHLYYCTIKSFDISKVQEERKQLFPDLGFIELYENKPRKELNKRQYNIYI